MGTMGSCRNFPWRVIRAAVVTKLVGRARESQRWRWHGGRWLDRRCRLVGLTGAGSVGVLRPEPELETTADAQHIVDLQRKCDGARFIDLFAPVLCAQLHQHLEFADLAEPRRWPQRQPCDLGHRRAVLCCLLEQRRRIALTHRGRSPLQQLGRATGDIKLCDLLMCQ